MTVVPELPPAPVGQQMLWGRQRAAVSPSLSRISEGASDAEAERLEQIS